MSGATQVRQRLLPRNEDRRVNPRNDRRVVCGAGVVATLGHAHRFASARRRGRLRGKAVNEAGRVNCQFQNYHAICSTPGCGRADTHLDKWPAVSKLCLGPDFYARMQHIAFQHRGRVITGAPREYVRRVRHNASTGHTSSASRSLTLIVGDRIRLALDHDLAVRVLGSGGALVHPSAHV